MDPRFAAEYYRFLGDREVKWLELHYRHAERTLALVSAILAVSLLALYQTGGGLWALAVIIGPVANMILCYAGPRLCDRFYQRFLEDLTIEAKIEPLVGLSDPRAAGSAGVFREDQAYLPQRWQEGRGVYKTASEFVKHHMALGANKLIRRVFWVLGFANLLLAIGITLWVCLVLVRMLCSVLNGA
jgi:hypothetical protein